MADTRPCEVGIGSEDLVGHPMVVLCGQPGRFYARRGPSQFGIYLCEQHKDVGRVSG